MSGVVAEVSSAAELSSLCGSHAGLTVVLLWAPWHVPSTHLVKVLSAIAQQERSARCATVNVDVCGALASALGANQVPFVAFFDPRGTKVDSLAGADPPALVAKVKALASRTFAAVDSGEATALASVAGDSSLNARLEALVNYSSVMLFMKGSKAQAFCGFSRQTLDVLNTYGVEYSTFDILKDDEVRQGLKEFSNWKTYPQLYIEGQLIGGIDIIREMHEDGSLAEAFPSSAAKGTPPLEERMKGLISKDPVMLFMKGNPETPRCGFSRKLVAILQANAIEFSTFDILEDEDVRQGLKTYSNWPTFPQLYAKGKLIGGIDIVNELLDEGVLKEELGL